MKLKQASPVLGVSPKDLQNLVQLKVLRPRRKDSVFWFDRERLLEAKVAFYLKESLGTSTEMLARFTEAFAKNITVAKSASLRYVWLRSRPARGQEPVEVEFRLPTWHANSRGSSLAPKCIKVCLAEEEGPVGAESLRESWNQQEVTSRASLSLRSPKPFVHTE